MADPFTPGLRGGDPYKLYLLSNTKISARCDMRPFGIKVEPIDYCAEWFRFRRDEYEVAELIALFRRAHAMCFADRGSRVIPRWMIVDLILMPSGVMLVVVGQDHLAEQARKLERGPNRDSAAPIRDLLRTAADDGYQGPIPVAAYAALPTPIRGRWVGGSIWWSLVPGQALGYAVRRIALRCYGASQEVGVAQFDNAKALHVQQHFGDLRVINTTLDIHRLPNSFVYEVDLENLPADGAKIEPTPPAGDIREIDLDGGTNLTDDLGGIQRDIDAGKGYCVLAGSPDQPGRLTFYPDHREPKLKAQPASRPVNRNGNDKHFTTGIRQGHPFRLCLLSNSRVVEALNPSPFGVPVQRIDFRDKEFCFRGEPWRVKDLLKLFEEANSLSYEEGGLGIPDWALAELMLMPSAVLLALADQKFVRDTVKELKKEPVTDRRQTRIIPLVEDDRDRLHNSLALSELLETAAERNYLGPLPVAGYAAAPTQLKGYWIGWSLWSLVPGKGLGYTLKRLALECYRATSESAVAQFNMARGLDVNTDFGPLRITNALVPAHPAPGAFAYEIDVGNLPADGGPVRHVEFPRWLRELDPEDARLWENLRRMQSDIDNGAKYYILPRGQAKTRSPLVPIGREYPGYRKLIGAVRAKLRRRAHPVRHRRWPDQEHKPQWPEGRQ